MTGDATTLPLRDAADPGGRARLTRWLRDGQRGSPRGYRHGALAGALGLAGDRAAQPAGRGDGRQPAEPALADDPHNFYPHWMAGPLGGLWPGLTGNGTTLKYLFTGAIVPHVRGLPRRAPARRRAAGKVDRGGILAVHAIFILSPPLALTDLFNYVNYGRMEVVHHLNPYTSIPILEPHDDPSYALSNWHQLLSPYGPLFTMLTFAVVPLGVAGSFWALKVVLAATSLGTILLVWKCARLLGRDPVKAIALVGLNPIVLVWGLGGDHNDFLMLFCIMLGFYLLLRGPRAGAPPRVAGGGARLVYAALAGAVGRGRGVHRRDRLEGLRGRS